MIAPVYSASPERYESMDYRRCGRSGIQLPLLSLGLWHNFGSHKPFEEVKAMVSAISTSPTITALNMALLKRISAT